MSRSSDQPREWTNRQPLRAAHYSAPRFDANDASVGAKACNAETRETIYSFRLQPLYSLNLVYPYYVFFSSLEFDMNFFEHLKRVTVWPLADTWFKIWGDGAPKIFAVPQNAKFGGRRGTHCLFELNVGSVLLSGWPQVLESPWIEKCQTENFKLDVLFLTVKIQYSWIYFAYWVAGLLNYCYLFCSHHCAGPGRFLGYTGNSPPSCFVK